jgi:hypothetical protein
MKDIGNVCKISLDGVDCPINEHIPFNKKYYSYKWNGAAVKYIIGIYIQTGWICWFNGNKILSQSKTASKMFSYSIDHNTNVHSVV